jgi:hypothetical protein
MDMKQTSVEWLVEQLARKHNEFQALTFYYDHRDEIEQAKQMEKEQMIAFANDVSREILNENIHSPFSIEQYYNETYNK